MTSVLKKGSLELTAGADVLTKRVYRYFASVLLPDGLSVEILSRVKIAVPRWSVRTLT